MALASCIISAAAAAEYASKLRSGAEPADVMHTASCLSKAAVALTSYRASLVPFHPPWWRAPDRSLGRSTDSEHSYSLCDMSSWLLPQTAAADSHPHTGDSSSSTLSSSASIACLGFSAVLRGTTAFVPCGSDPVQAAVKHSGVCSGDGGDAAAPISLQVNNVNVVEASGESYGLTACTLSLIEAILQHRQCDRALLMLLAKAWAWACMKAALLNFSLPTASNPALACIAAALPPPLSSTFSIPLAASLSARLRGVAERLLEISCHSSFYPAAALCLALTSDIVTGMSCKTPCSTAKFIAKRSLIYSASAFVDACACVAFVASAAHESSSINLNTNARTAHSAVCFTSALLILCAVADFNIRSPSLLRSALAAAIACCCPRGRILLASSAFPCDIWGGGRPARNCNDREHIASVGEAELGDFEGGAMGEVARAVQGQGGVFDVSELLSDEGEGAASRVALAQCIGGEFVNQLMQVRPLF